MQFLVVISGIASAAAVAPAAASETGLVINGFWLIVALLNFVLLFVILVPDAIIALPKLVMPKLPSSSWK